MAVGDRIRVARRKAGLTQEGLARRAGLTLKAVGEIERGEVQDPHLSSLTKIADALGTTVGALAAEEELVSLDEAPPAGRSAHVEDLDEVLIRPTRLTPQMLGVVREILMIYEDPYQMDDLYLVIEGGYVEAGLKIRDHG